MVAFVEFVLRQSWFVFGRVLVDPISLMVGDLGRPRCKIRGNTLLPATLQPDLLMEPVMTSDMYSWVPIDVS